MTVAIAGIVVMFADSLDAGRLLGNLLALGVSVCFAAQVTMLRKFHATVDMLPQVMIAGLVSLVPALRCSPDRSPPHAHDSPSSASWAACSLAPGCLLATAASRHLVGDRARTPRTARADHRADLGVAADGRSSPSTPTLVGGAHRDRRRHRERGLRGVARPGTALHDPAPGPYGRPTARRVQAAPQTFPTPAVLRRRRSSPCCSPASARAASAGCRRHRGAAHVDVHRARRSRRHHAADPVRDGPLRRARVSRPLVERAPARSCFPARSSASCWARSRSAPCR